MAGITTIAGVDLEIVERGKGRPLLFLHAGEGLGPDRPWLDLMAEQHRVIAPAHPGFGRSSLPDWMSTVDDLAYLYLDLADRMGLSDATLVGASFGGWIAAEMMVRSTARFSRLVLAAPLGIKVGPRDVRDIADMHAMTREEFLSRAWADPAKGAVDYSKLPEMELAQIARSRETLTLFGWRPYMHNPHLKRWLHRIDRPTRIIWGERDRIVSRAYCEAFAAEIAGARVNTIPECGHFSFWEQPEAAVALLAD